MNTHGFSVTVIRIGFVIAILSFLAIGERYFLRDRAYRWRGYTLCLASAALCAAFGFLLDLFTVRLSPEYFNLTRNLKLSVIALTSLNTGAVTGLFAGTLIGAVFVIRSRDLINVSKHVPWSLLLLLVPILTLALVGGFMGGYLPLLDYGNTFTSRFPNDRSFEAYNRVKQIHNGVYLGGELGFLLTMIQFKAWFRLL